MSNQSNATKLNMRINIERAAHFDPETNLVIPHLIQLLKYRAEVARKILDTNHPSALELYNYINDQIKLVLTL